MAAIDNPITAEITEDDEVELYDLNNSIRQTLKNVDINSGDTSDSPSQRDLSKQQTLKYFNVRSLEKDYLKFNDEHAVNLNRILVDNVLSQLRDHLEKHGFVGHLKPVGSFYDGTKVVGFNEFDFMFVCDGSKLKIKRLESDGISCNVYRRQQGNSELMRSRLLTKRNYESTSRSDIKSKVPKYAHSTNISDRNEKNLTPFVGIETHGARPSEQTVCKNGNPKRCHMKISNSSSNIHKYASWKSRHVPETDPCESAPNVMNDSGCDDDIDLNVVDPKLLREEFADAIDSICEVSLQLPEGLHHGGFAWPKFSGVRVNKPAVTLLFVQTPKGGRPKHISIDITLALSVPPHLERHIAVKAWTAIGPMRSLVSVPLNFSCEGDVHVIPVEDSHWSITSTLLEAKLMERIPDAPIKKCIKLAKITARQSIDSLGCSYLEYIWKVDRSEKVKGWQVIIERELKSHEECRTRQKERKRTNLKRLLRHGHVVLTPDISQEYTDIRRSPVSLVSAAIKHQALRTYCTLYESKQSYEGLEFGMLMEMLRNEFGDLGQQTVRHMWLPEDIKMVSVAPYAELRAVSLIRGAKFECLRLGKRVRGTMGVDFVKRHIILELSILMTAVSAAVWLLTTTT